MKRLLRIGAAAIMGLSMTTGIAMASSSSIDETGPDSENEIEVRYESERRVENRNVIRATNNNPQMAMTGEAEVEDNTTGGDATSGDATNDSLLKAKVAIDNSSGAEGSFDEGVCGCGGYGDISNTGPDSENEIEFKYESKVRVENNNTISVVNNNKQMAMTGEAEVEHNTTGGDATSGDAMNVGTFELNVEIAN